MTPEQCRQARQLLGRSKERLAKAVGLAPGLISIFEQYGHLPNVEEDWQAKIRAALEAAGVDGAALVRKPDRRL